MLSGLANKSPELKFLRFVKSHIGKLAASTWRFPDVLKAAQGKAKRALKNNARRLFIRRNSDPAGKAEKIP